MKKAIVIENDPAAVEETGNANANVNTETAVTTGTFTQICFFSIEIISNIPVQLAAELDQKHQH